MQDQIISLVIAASADRRPIFPEWNGKKKRHLDMQKGDRAMAKRNCRRTADENSIHKKAVELRKKTDEQLVHYVEDRVEKARSEGYNKGKAKQTERGAKEFIALLQLKKIPGIGAVTINKLIRVAEENGYL